MTLCSISLSHGTERAEAADEASGAGESDAVAIGDASGIADRGAQGGHLSDGYEVFHRRDQLLYHQRPLLLHLHRRSQTITWLA